jgi:hypothetical protein
VGAEECVVNEVVAKAGHEKPEVDNTTGTRAVEERKAKKDEKNRRQKKAKKQRRPGQASPTRGCGPIPGNDVEADAISDTKKATLVEWPLQDGPPSATEDV